MFQVGQFAWATPRFPIKLGARGMMFFTNTLVCILMLINSTACVPFAQNLPPTTQNPPLYPNAQQTTTTKAALGTGPSYLITFQTADKPEAVFAYYKNILNKDGWEFVSALSGPDKISFAWGPGPKDPAYEFYVVIKS